MKTKLFPVFFVVLCFYIGCQIPPSEEDLHPLVGTWSLTQLLTETTAYSNIDTVSVALGGTILPINSGQLVFSGSIMYDTNDGIGGQVVLEEDYAASLAGTLPVNIGTNCNPIVVFSSVASDGSWSADVETGEFQLNLDYDQLDIQGGFSFNEDQQTVDISYTSYEPLDTLLITSIIVNSSTEPIESLCLPASTEITRTLSFSKD